MSSARFSARLDTSHHGPPRLFKDAEVVADSLTGIHKCHFVVNRSCRHKGFYVSPQVKIQRIQIWRAWRPCSGSSSTYPSVLISIIETSRTARLKCAVAPSCMYHTRVVTTSGTSSSSFGRSCKGKFR
jgi:hypothetical protein